MTLKSIIGNRITRNASWIITCKILEAIMGIVISMLTARYLGPTNYGKVNYAYAVVSFITPVAQLGLTSTLVHELVKGEDEDGTLLGSAVFISVISSSFCIIGIALFVSLTNPGDTITLIVCIIHSAILYTQSIELIQYWYQSKLISKYTAVLTLIGYLVASIYQIIILIASKSVEWYAVVKVLEHVIISIGMLFFYWRIGGNRLKVSILTIKRLLRISKHYAVSGMFVMLCAFSDRIMIKLMLGDAEMGYYSSAVTCANIAEFVFLAIIDSFKPVILEQYKNSKARFETGMCALYFIVIYMSLIQNVLMTVFPNQFISLFFGEAYLPAKNALQIIVWYTTFSFIGSVRVVWILAQEKQRSLWKIGLCGSIINVALNVILIPYFGICGAAATALFTQVFNNYLAGYFFTELRGNNALIAKGFNPKYLISFVRTLEANK